MNNTTITEYDEGRVNTSNIDLPVTVMTDKLDLSEFVNAVKSFILTRDSSKTRKDYERHLQDFINKINKPLYAIKPEDLVKYREQLLSDGRGNATHAQSIAAIRSFLKWSKGLDLHSISYEVVSLFLKIPAAKVVNPYKTLTDAEIARVLALSENLRDKAMFALMIGSGLRVSEVSNVKFEDFYEGQAGWSLVVRSGKGNKDRIVPLLNDVFNYILGYADETGGVLGKTKEYVFKTTKRVSKDGKLTDRAIENAISNMITNSNIEKDITPHSLRHSFAFRALKAGTRLIDLSKILGHSNITVTQRYVDHFEMDEMRMSLPSLPLFNTAKIGARA